MVTPQTKITCLQGHKSTVGRETTHCPVCNEKVQMGWKTAFSPGIISQETKDRTARVLSERYNSMQWYPGIAEMGYDDRPAFADNWNNYPSGFGDWLELYFDSDTLWSDEWAGCSDCGKAVRTSADSYSWEPSFVWASDCEIVCHECVGSDPEAIIEEYQNRTDRAMPSDFKPLLQGAGFECLELDDSCPNHATGYHPGQNDIPAKALQEIYDSVGERWFQDHFDYLFVINDVGQFDCHWSIWGRRKEQEED